MRVPKPELPHYAAFRRLTQAQIRTLDTKQLIILISCAVEEYDNRKEREYGN